MEGNWLRNPTGERTSLADLSTLLGGHIAVCSSPEFSLDGTNFMKVVEQVPVHMNSNSHHRITSLVDFAGSTSGKLCNSKIYGVNGENKAITHHDDFDRDLSAVEEYGKYRDFHENDFKAKAEATGKTIKELATKGFAIKNSQWNSYWRGKVAGGLCMALTMSAGKSVSDSDLVELKIGRLQKDSSDLRAVIAVMIDGGPVTQQEQREMPQICDDVVFDLRRQGYHWASNAHVLLVRFPDVQTMLRSLDGEQNLCRSERFEMQQKDEHLRGRFNLCWEFKERPDFRRSAGASLFENKWEEALKYDDYTSGLNLYQAAASGDADGVKTILKSKVRLTDVPVTGETALHALAAGGDSEGIRLLLGELKDDEERKAYPKQFKGDDERQEYVNKSNKWGQTPLLLAKNEGVATLLLQSKAEVDKKDFRGQTPLHLAENEGVATLLLQSKAEVDKKDNYGQTPLHLAMNEGVATLLLQSKAEVDKRGDSGQTPLSIASEYGWYEVVQLLLGATASVNTSDNHGNTPLHEASYRNEEGIARLLLQSKAEVDKKNNRGRTPLFNASEYGKYKVVQLLLGATASVNTSDKDGQTPLDVAREKGNDDIVKLLTEGQ